MAKEGYPDWIAKLIEKGGDVSDCMGMLEKIDKMKQSEDERNERAQKRDLQKLELEAQKAEVAQKSDIQKLELETQKAEVSRQVEIEKARLEHEIKMRECELKDKELEMHGPGVPRKTGSNVKISLPRYVDGEDVEVFLCSFERLAVLHKWPKEDWTVRLVPQLSGKALQAYSRMAVYDSADYDKVKIAILDRFGLNSWLYREKFRNSRQEIGETFKEYAIRSSGVLEHWVNSEKVGGDYGKLYDLVLREQLMFSSQVDLQVWLRERQPMSAQVLVEQAEAYQMAHKQTGRMIAVRDSSNSSKGVGSGSGVYVPPNNRWGNSNRSDQTGPGANNRWGDQTYIRRCYKCNSTDHLLPDCPERKGRNESSGGGNRRNNNQSNANQLLTSPKKNRFTGEVVKIPVVVESKDAVEKELENGLKLVKGKVNGQEVWALRDTGCTTVCVARRLVGKLDESHESREISLANGDVWNCPEVTIDLETPFLTGRVVALVMDNPFSDVIVGNVGHIAEEETGNKDIDVVQAVETRAKKVSREGDEIVQREVEKDILENKGKVGQDEQSVRHESREMHRVFGGADDLKREQQVDTSLTKVRSLVQAQIEEDKPHFKLDNDILVRYFKMKNGEVVKQIVVPLKYRDAIMSLAHDSSFAGHLGNRKTRQRIMQNFFWPGIFIDVAKYCKACPNCQKSVPKGRVGKVPLVSIPPMDIPFKRIAMDIVGPLNRTKSGNRYILVICDYATKYPEAIPLKTIDTQTIANELIWFFSRVGIPQEILTDMGSNFTSSLMKELCGLLQIRKLCSTPYHPQANGLVENFNGTLKKMLRCYAQESPSEWDRHIPYVLFAYREVPHETTGFSPFELLYSWPVTGPLAILRDEWEPTAERDVTASVLSYVIDARNKFQEMTKLAHQNEGKAKKKQKIYFDKKARHRSLTVGDKVLVLLPTSANKLMAQWKGPYQVVQKVSDTNYKIQCGRKVNKTFHINMLKKWHEKERLEQASSETTDVLQLIADITDNSDQYEEVSKEIGNPLLTPTEGIEQVDINKELDEGRQGQLKKVCREYKDVLTDVPGKTHLAQHEVKLNSDIPIYKKPYVTPYALKVQVQKEIENMIEAGIVQKSNSAWAAPIVIVPKKDKSIRLCVDYRGLNQQTIFDPQPMPKLEEIINKLGKAKYISKLDLTKGYWQIPLSEAAQEISAFVTSFGHYQFTVMPFGMTNSAASFVRLMKKVLEGKEEFSDSFIDDILVFSEHFSEHLKHVDSILHSLRMARLTAKPSKCSLGYQETEFLAHVVGNGQVKPTKEKVRAINEIPVPITKKKVRAFIGLTNFYRRFIPDFADIAAPLTDMTAKRAPNKVVWTERQEGAFRTLKQKISSYPVLYNPDFEKEFILQTDSSDRGIGAVLIQEVDGERHPILYMSKKLLAREQAYSTVEKECLAIVKSVTSLREYLYGTRFVVESDHYPLQWLKEMKGKNQRLLRWSLTLQEYNYTVKHVPGKKNTVADVLSRCCDQE